MDEIANKSKDQQAKSQASSSVSLSLGCHQKVQPTFRMDFPASDNLPEKHCHRSAQQLAFPLVLLVVKLTTKISQHGICLTFEPWEISTWGIMFT